MTRENPPSLEEPVAGSNITSRIFNDLRRQILKGELAPGERLLGERELAQHYDTNRNTLREAVRRLEQLGLVSVRHGQGVTVADFRRTGTLELLAPFIEAGPDLGEISHIVEDLLPARLLFMEFATRLAVRRATEIELLRLEDITELLIAAIEKGEPVVIAHGFHRWLDALVEASRSLAIRWVANPFLELYRGVIDRYPTLWVLDPGYPAHLRELMAAFRAGDEEAAIKTTRDYYERVDSEIIRLLDVLLSLKRRAAARDARAHAEAEAGAEAEE
jgi:GntR family transcriptional regulator, transcriptional repressor for pyruvate dehydrogenase complex